MISGKQLLSILIGAAIGAGGWMVGHQESRKGNGAASDDLRSQLHNAQEQVAMLEKENISLRSLAQGGGEVAVPQEMISRVEKDYGVTFLSSPVFHMIAREELGYRVEAAIESRLGPQGIDDRQEAWRLLGILNEKDELLELLSAVKSVGQLGWFDEGTGEAWLTDQFDLENIPDQALMLRLLTRILLNQHFPAPSAYPGDDAERAWEALHEGAAAGTEARYFAESAKRIGFLPMNENTAKSRLLLAMPEFIQGLVQFPTVAGRALADSLYVKGTDELAEKLANIPDDTFGIVLPGENGRSGKITFSKMEDEMYLRESAGYLGLRLWIAETGDHALAGEIASDWVKDGYLLFSDGESSSAIVWEVELETKATSGKFESVALHFIAALAGKEAAPKLGEIVTSRDGRFLRILRKSDRSVVFLNTATRETAAREW